MFKFSVYSSLFSFWLIFGLGCGKSDTSAVTPLVYLGDMSTPVDMSNDEEPLQFLSPQAHLARIAITLTGSRPSLAALTEVAENPGTLDQWVDRYLEDPRFGLTIRQMYNEVLSLKTFLTLFVPKPPVSQESFTSLNRSIQEAPLRLIEHVITQNRPFSEIVTADYTLADANVAGVWGLEHTGGTDQWVETRWPGEDRIHSGLLTEEYLYVRHYTTPLNAQRGRANIISKALLCHDYLAQDIAIDSNVDLSDADAIKQAVRAPACAGCHESLDPFSANFWSYEFFTLPASIEEYPYSHHKPEYEMYRRYFTDRTPGYLGTQTQDLAALGDAIARDPRLYRCAVRRFFGFFNQQRVDEVPREMVDLFLPGFEASGYSAKSLAKTIVLSDEFRSIQRPGSTKASLLMRPYAIDETVRTFDNFSWRFNFRFPLFEEQGATAPYGEVSLLTDSFVGFGVLAGGTDDYVVKQSRHSMTVMRSLVYKSLAESFAGQMIAKAAQTETDTSSALIQSLDDTDPLIVKASLVRLVGRLFSKIVDAEHEDVDALWQLYRDALVISDEPSRAWSVVLAAMLQDDRFYHY
jgi:hypothetical protein